MNRIITFLGILVFLLASCSSGKKALQQGDYFSAVVKATDRLKSDPDNKNATKVLKDGYPLAIDWSQEEMDLVLSSNSAFRWEKAINLMQQVNRLSNEIRSTPAARKIIISPKTYTTELNMAFEKAAEERYNAGMAALNQNTRESAKEAFSHFSKANEFIPGYKNVTELMASAKEIATTRVILQTIPVHSEKYRLSSEFFYNQVFEYLNNQYGPRSFVDFYTPLQAKRENLENPDLIVNIEFFDFSVGNLMHSEKEETVKKRVKIESKDTTRAEYRTYEAKIKTFSDQVLSGGNLRVRIAEPSTDKLLLDELIPGSFSWVNEYAMYVGDEEALNKNQLEMTKKKVVPLPPEQELFVEFTKPIYTRLIASLNRFFRQYN